jgi:K+ transporter
VLHERNLFVTVRNHEVPWVVMDKRVEAESLGSDCWEVIIHYGFRTSPMCLLRWRSCVPGLQTGLHVHQLFPVA